MAALADFLNYYNHERPHSALGGLPPISRTRGSDFRISVERMLEPVDIHPLQPTLDDYFEEPTS